MFTDGRSRRVVFLAHCLLNQNAISDGTAEVPAAHREILRTVLDARVGVVQLPCPELCCLGLDRGDPKGGERPVVAENTRIRRAMGSRRQLPAAGADGSGGLADSGVPEARICRAGHRRCGPLPLLRGEHHLGPGPGTARPGRVYRISPGGTGSRQGLTVPVIGIKPSAPEALDGYGPFWGNEVCDGDSTHTGWRASGGHGPVLAGVP